MVVIRNSSSRGTVFMLVFCALLAVECNAQAGGIPSGPMRDAATAGQATTLNLMDARLAKLEAKLADLEQKLATQQAKLSQQNSELGALKSLPNAFKNHSHEVVIHSIDYSLADVKDMYGNKKAVVVPGPSWGNPKGVTGGPKVSPSPPF